ncbi:MAG: hypothetical protein QOK02_2727, partial [Mycobacterium sp.]|nr:hypothetical protein [Mycobacterium sp.]
ARIDRLTAPAKRTVNAAAVIGSRFTTELLTVALEEGDDSGQAALAELVHSELIDQVMFTPQAEYAFRHSLVQTVAYESQLKPARAQLHRRLAAAIQRHSAALDENAALIAGHLEAAGDLHEAFGWHMRAGAWFTNRDISAARTSWKRAQQLADQLPANEPNKRTMQVAPRALVCGSTWRVGGSVTDTGFEELRELCTGPDTQVPLVIGMAGLLMELALHARVREAAQRASEYIDLLDSINNPTLTVGALYPAIYAKCEVGEMADVLHLAQRVIDLAGGDPTKGNFLTGSPLAFATAMRASARCALGQRYWKEDFDQALQVSRVDPTTYVSIVMFKYVLGIPFGALLPDTAAMEDTAHALQTAQRCSEDFALHAARLARGITLISADSANATSAFDLLAEARAAALKERFILTLVPIIDLQTAAEKARTDDLDGAIELSRHIIAEQFRSGATLYLGCATGVLVDSLLRRGRATDTDEAQAAIDTLAAVPTDPGFVLYELPLLRMRALLARARDDDRGYRAFIDRYFAMAEAHEFEGHLATARAMR